MYDEQDDDFLFTRVSKRQKTAQQENDPEPAPAPVTKKTAGRGKQSNAKRRASPSPVPQEVQEPVATTKRPTRRKANQTAPDVPDDIPVAKTRKTGRRTRSSIEKTGQDSEVTRADATEDEGRVAAVTGTPVDAEKSQGDAGSDSRQIALPFSDTPINNRNKEFRKKAGGARRSSLGMRGRRASSLIENGHSAIPHREVDPAEFYKHIEAEGLSEPRRMKQLLTWCGERALSEKPPLGSSNSNAILGGEALSQSLVTVNC